jgi:Uri superfamily endonuclease
LFWARTILSHGTYILILRLPNSQHIQIGKLGLFALGAGYYAYVGSAFGSGGLAGRLRHHQKVAPRPHWHIDYLRQAANLDAVWMQESGTRREHEWAGILERMPGVSIPIARFGSSDCRCPAHLFYFGEGLPSLEKFQRETARHFPKDAAITLFTTG